MVVTHGSQSLLFLTHGSAVSEVDYTMSPLHPDAVFLCDTSADAVLSDRYPDALWLGTDGAAALSDGAVTPCPVGSTVTLWEDGRLTLVSDTTWLLRLGEESVWISTDPAAVPADPTALCLYVGVTPTTPPPQSYAVACSKAFLRRNRPAQTEQVTYIVNESITYVPLAGEWSVSPWR